MKAALAFLILGSFVTHSIATAHPNHSHAPAKPINEEQAKAKGREHLTKLIEAKKIPESWTKAELLGAEKKQYGKKTEWMVRFRNKTIKEEGKKTLYIFMRISGKYLAANYTGK